jgi:hypothetical protein
MAHYTMYVYLKKDQGSAIHPDKGVGIYEACPAVFIKPMGGAPLTLEIVWIVLSVRWLTIMTYQEFRL